MASPPRIAPGGYFLHVYNRANGFTKLFDTSADYDGFVRLVGRCAALDRMRIVAWCLMPNHWHFLVWPREDGDLSRFIQRLKVRHTKHRHLRDDTTGRGHVYQSRFRSSVIQDDRHLLTVCRYIERNPVRAGLVVRATDWRWSSARDRVKGAREDADASIPLEPLPVDVPADWWRRLCEQEAPTDLERLRSRLKAGTPVGDENWEREAADALGLRCAQKRGRPRKEAGFDNQMQLVDVRKR